MQWELIIALIIAIPAILFPAAYVWYINFGGLAALLKEAREKRVVRKAKQGPGKGDRREPEYQKALSEKPEKYTW